MADEWADAPIDTTKSIILRRVVTQRAEIGHMSTTARRLSAGVLALCAVCATLGAAAQAGALSVPGLAGGDAMSVFRVIKSENRNEVHYGLRVDAACSPRSEAPLVAYWRMFERGPSAIEGLAAHEGRAYGIGPQRLVRVGERVELQTTLYAVPTRALRIIAVAQQGGCRAGAFTRIGAATLAQLDAVHVVTAGFGLIDHLELLGHTADGRVVREVLQP